MGRKNASHSNGNSEKKRRGYTAGPSWSLLFSKRPTGEGEPDQYSRTRKGASWADKTLCVCVFVSALWKKETEKRRESQKTTTTTNGWHASWWVWTKRSVQRNARTHPRIRVWSNRELARGQGWWIGSSSFGCLEFRRHFTLNMVSLREDSGWRSRVPELPPFTAPRTTR